MSAFVSSAPLSNAAPVGIVAQMRAAAGRWFASHRTVCDLALLKDEDLAHLGVSRREIRAIRLVARATAPVTNARSSAPVAPAPLRTGPLGLLTSAALRR